jgi:hypothetical protein
MHSDEVLENHEKRVTMVRAGQRNIQRARRVQEAILDKDAKATDPGDAPMKVALCKTYCFTRLFLRSEMKQGSPFPYISYAVVRRARIGFSLMTHCICHERGTRFNAVPGSTPNIQGFTAVIISWV